MKFKTSQSAWAVALTLLILEYLVGCSETTDPSAATPSANAIQVASATLIESAPATPAENKGTVISNKIVGAYSYIELDVDGATFWLATSISDVKSGDRIAWKDHAVMTNFKSKALNRKFALILFVDRIMTESDVDRQLHSGVVVEYLNAAGYSYIRVEENGANVWLAAPETDLEIGQSIRWDGGSPMRNFFSRSLDRNFDEIIFISTVQGS
ncbi:hypothetical protein N8198_09925 [Gammaproteobacteria bacterium]|nr:hypothetical protein [Gammaproteobacteria bacterium]